jgi:sensor domain CHASE-containing protein
MPINEIKKLIIPTLFIACLSSCQTQQREQSESSRLIQTDIEIRYQQDRREEAQTVNVKLETLRGYINQIKYKPSMRQTAKELLYVIKESNKKYNLALDPQIEDAESSLKN